MAYLGIEEIRAQLGGLVQQVNEDFQVLMGNKDGQVFQVVMETLVLLGHQEELGQQEQLVPEVIQDDKGPLVLLVKEVSKVSQVQLDQ